MQKFLSILLLALFVAGPASSQEEPAAEPTAADADTDTVAAADDDDAPDIDDSDLDLQTYEEDEDDFVPTEEIPADEPIPFPSNI